ncbi:MAG: sulfur carrier protein ThiS [Pyrinomonadaceae bacterium]
MAGINILLNGETLEVAKEIKLDELLEFFSLPRKRVAIEINNSVVSRSDWPDIVIGEGDKIEVVHFVGGG